MATTETDICNLALAALGDEATVVSIDPPEGSAQADHCAQWYPIARSVLLEAHDWKFARRRVQGAPLTTTVGPWAYAYAMPAGAVRVRAVLPPGATADYNQGLTEIERPFDIETLEDGTEVIVTDQPEAVIRFTSAAVDVGKFPPLAVQALVHLLASYLAGPVLKNEAGRAEARAQLQLHTAWLGKAQASDMNQQRRTEQHTPQQLAARGGIPWRFNQ
jgi:hypothetical protein